MENSKPIPISLKIVAWLPILFGLYSAGRGLYALGFVLLCLIEGGEAGMGIALGLPDVLMALIVAAVCFLMGRGLLRLNRVWRLVVLVITTVALILRTVGWGRWLISPDIKISWDILPEIAILLVMLWVLRVLLRSDVRVLFKTGTGQTNSPMMD